MTRVLMVGDTQPLPDIQRALADHAAEHPIVTLEEEGGPMFSGFLDAAHGIAEFNRSEQSADARTHFSRFASLTPKQRAKYGKQKHKAQQGTQGGKRGKRGGRRR